MKEHEIIDSLIKSNKSFEDQIRKITDYSNYLAENLDETIDKMEDIIKYCEFLRRKEDPDLDEFLANEDIYIRTKNIEEVINYDC